MLIYHATHTHTHIIHVLYVPSLQWNFQWTIGLWQTCAVLSSLPQFLEVDYIRASVLVLKTRLRMGYTGQTSLIYTLILVESRIWTDRNDKWYNRYSAFILLCPYLMIKCHFKSHVWKPSASYTWEKASGGAKIGDSRGARIKFSEIICIMRVQLRRIYEDCYFRDVRKFRDYA